MSTLTKIGCAAFMFGLAIGCDSVKAPPGGHVDQLPEGQYPRIVAAEGLQEAIVFGERVVDVSTTAKPMRVTQAARNVHDETIRVQYRFEFFDASGRPLKSNLGWRYLEMPSRQEIFLEGAAMEPTATEWRLTVRPAR